MLDFIKDLEGNFSTKKISDFSLNGMKNALKILGNPEDKLKNVIHIAGTNGKGSVASFLASILTKSGYKVCKYTSPHLEKFNERINFCEQDITDDEFLSIKDDIWTRIADLNLTFFEITTIFAIVFFSHQKHDFVIFETGLGGRLDATNVFDEKLFSIITSISLDHQLILGDTVEKIAEEKFAIIKGSKYCVSSFFEKNENLLQKIKNMSLKTNLYISRKEFLANGSSEENFNFKFDQFCFKIKNLKSQISGIWQIENASIAIATCVLLKNLENFEKITENSIKIGVLSAKNKGRMTKLSVKEVSKILNPKQFSITIDISHNQDGIEKFCNHIKNIHGKIGVFSQLFDKKCEKIYQSIANCGFEKIYCTEIKNNRKLDGFEIKKGLEKFIDAEKVAIKNNLEEVFESIKMEKDRREIFIFGSNFLISDFLKYLKN